ncbi:hypothetical protein ACJ41O_010802 [Fusarium nematophilum]
MIEDSNVNWERWQRTPTPERIQIFVNWLGEDCNRDSLLILDDAELFGAASIQAALKYPAWHIVMSTRDSNIRWTDREFRDIRLPPLTLSDTVSILEGWLNKLQEDEIEILPRKDLGSLAQVVHGHPLAAQNAVPFLIDHFATSDNAIEEFVRLFEHGNLDEKEVFFKFRAKDRSLWDAFNASLKQLALQEDSESAVQLLHLLPYLRTDDDSIDPFLKMRKRGLTKRPGISNHATLLQSEYLIISKWLEKLRGVSLYITAGPPRSRSLNIHPLVLQFAQLLLDEEARKDRMRAVLEVFYELNERQGGNSHGHIVPHVNHCLQICSHLDISLRDLGLASDVALWLDQFSGARGQQKESTFDYTNRIESENPFGDTTGLLAAKADHFVMLCAATQNQLEVSGFQDGHGQVQSMVIKCVTSFKGLKNDLTKAGDHRCLGILASLGEAVDSLSQMAIQTSPPSVGPGVVALLTAPIKDSYWDLLAQLPPLPIVEELIDIFFSEANWHYQILDESFFADSYKTWVRANLRSCASDQPAPLELLFFPALLFQVLAVAVLFIPASAPARQTMSLWDLSAKTSLSDKYSRIGSHLAELFYQCSPMLVMVQHDLTKSLWFKTNSRGLAAWQFLGRAIRTINESDCTAATPIGCDIPLDRSNSFPTPVSPLAKPPIFTNRLFTYALGKKIHEILSSSAHTRAVSDYGIVTRLHAEIVDLWRNHHPALRSNNPDTTWDRQYPVVKRQRQLAKVMANSVILTLHRDHAAIHQESRGEAIKAALACLEAQHALMGLLPPNQQRAYGLSCHSIDACIFIAYATRLEDTVDEGMLDRVQATIQQSITRLGQLEDESSFAKHGAQAMWKALESIRARAGPAVAPMDVQAETSPLDTSDGRIEQDLNMALQNGQFHPGVFEQAGDVLLATPDLGFLGFPVTGSISLDEGILGDTVFGSEPVKEA